MTFVLPSNSCNLKYLYLGTHLNFVSHFFLFSLEYESKKIFFSDSRIFYVVKIQICNAFIPSGSSRVEEKRVGRNILKLSEKTMKIRIKKEKKNRKKYIMSVLALKKSNEYLTIFILNIEPW